MNYRERYELYLNDESFDEDFLYELKNIPEGELEERFYRELEFGTAGLRGINGAGSNRMNKYIIRRASQGYAEYLKSKSASPTCVIAYDNRLFSEVFTRETAAVLAANGIKTYIFGKLRPTPELSFAIRHLNTTGGIVLTASHNPPEYSGYKVYGADGCQLDTVSAGEVAELIFAQDGFKEIKLIPYEDGIKSGLIEVLKDDIDDAFIAAVLSQAIHRDVYSHPFKAVYTPLHGTGGEIMPKLMKEAGVTDLIYLDEQMKPDPYFTTTKSANPEDEAAFELSIEKGKAVSAKLLIASDPDADRLGIMALNKDGKYHKINGNTIGALLAYYVFQFKKDMPKDPCIVKSIVTSDLTDYIAEDFGVAHYDTLTGFKNICGIVREFEKKGTPNFVIGFEESYGYLVGTHARDKDSFVASMLILEMAKFYDKKGLSLFDVIEEIYSKYGYFREKLVSVTKKGKEGLEEIAAMMVNFREGYHKKLADFSLKTIYDYDSLKELDVATGSEKPIDEERQNCLKYRLSCGSWLALRPSGTEPKIKFYYSIRANSEEEAAKKLASIEESVNGFVKI